ncbi:MAG: transposase [Clostridia bacterium]|nr:transposase [Clostridia bacterium]
MSNYSKEFKEEALRLSDEIGVKKAASQLGIPYYTLADWRQSRKAKRTDTSVMSDDELRIRNRELERENAELRQANEILKDALGFFAKDRKR